jgi:hypothetical protein
MVMVYEQGPNGEIIYSTLSLQPNNPHSGQEKDNNSSPHLFTKLILAGLALCPDVYGYPSDAKTLIPSWSTVNKQ